VTEEMRTNFHNLATVEQEIRDEINCMAANEERPIDVAVRIRSFPNLRITAANKMRSSVKSSLSYSGSKIQFRTLDIKNSKVVSDNRKSVESFIGKLKQVSKRSPDPIFEEWKNALLFRGVSAESVVQFLESFKVNTENLRYETKLGIRYITDLNKYDELNDWSVCLMSSKTGKAYRLPSGEEIFLVKRTGINPVTGSGETITLRSLVPPVNELIDLEDVLKPEARSITEFKKYLSDKGWTDTRIRREQRPKERGLVMIYPLDPEFDEDQSRNRLETNVPVYALSLVFPSSRNDLGFRNYIENVSI
jgi:hypothetical protein